MTQHNDIIDLKRLYYIIKRQKFVIIMMTAFFISLATVYLFITPDKYRAETVILLDETVTNTISDVSSVNLTTYNSASIDSEVEVLRSKRITDYVVNKLEEQGYFSNVAQNHLQRDAILYNMIRANLSVGRIDKTYALSISYTSTDPQEAADVANAFADAYITDQLNLLYETSNRTIGWLQQKSEEIKNKSKEARSRLSEYRIQYNAETQKNIGNAGEGSDSAYNSDVALREFEALKLEVETYDQMYDSYLEKMRTISLEKNFPVTETLVYTYATPPIHKSEPKPVLVMGMAIIFGFGLSIIVALIRDLFDKSLRRAGQVSSHIGVDFLGFLPKIKGKKTRKLPFVTPDQSALCEIKLSTYSVDQSYSLYTDTMRFVKNGIELSSNTTPEKGCIVGIVSMLEDNDTFTASSNLATHCASEGHHTLFIDGTILKPTSNNRNVAMPVDRKRNLFNSKSDAQKFLSETVLYNEQYNLFMIGGIYHESMMGELQLNKQKITTLLEVCKEQYEYVVICLPPLNAASDLYAFTDEIDSFVVMGRWGETLPNALNFHLDLNRISEDKVAGVVLNNTNMKKMASHYGHQTYKNKRY